MLDTFNDAIDDTVTLEVTDNADNLHVIINLVSDRPKLALGIALTRQQVAQLAGTLLTLTR